MSKTISVGIVLMKDTLISGATGIDDIFHIASNYAKQKGQDESSNATDTCRNHKRASNIFDS